MSNGQRLHRPSEKVEHGVAVMAKGDKVYPHIVCPVTVNVMGHHSPVAAAYAAAVESVCQKPPIIAKQVDFLRAPIPVAWARNPLRLECMSTPHRTGFRRARKDISAGGTRLRDPHAFPVRVCGTIAGNASTPSVHPTFSGTRACTRTVSRSPVLDPRRWAFERATTLPAVHKDRTWPQEIRHFHDHMISRMG